MEKIQLFTEKGEFVHETEMPKFSIYPEVVIWGNRVFQVQTVQKIGEITRYNEVSAAVVF
jgi:hypothetical protein